MTEDENRPDGGGDSPEPKPARPSLAFSWATLGFILGALFVVALPPKHREQAEAPPAPPEAPVAKKLPPLRLTTIEAVFDNWGQYALWGNDTTEVAMFDPETKDFTDCYEVARVKRGDGSNDYLYFFRSILGLTRPVLNHGIPGDSPLRFTETEDQRQQWLKDVNEENWRSIQRSLVRPQSAQPESSANQVVPAAPPPSASPPPLPPSQPTTQQNGGAEKP